MIPACRPCHFDFRARVAGKSGFCKRNPGWFPGLRFFSSLRQSGVVGFGTVFRMKKIPFLTDDFCALLLGLFITLLALGTLAQPGLQAWGWAASIQEWVNPAQAVKPVDPKSTVSPAISLAGTLGFLLAALMAIDLARGNPVGKNLPRHGLVLALGYGCFLLGHHGLLAVTDTRKLDSFGLNWSMGLTGEAGYLLALLAGLILGNLLPIWANWLRASASTELFIKAAIILVGVSLASKTLGQAGRAGELISRGLAAIVEAYLLYWALVYLMARTLFKFPREWAAPLASGISICGVSAAMATGSAIRSRPGVPVIVSSLVVVFSTIELLILPRFAHWLLPNEPMVAAAWMGLAVKTDGAATAAGAVTEALYNPGEGSLMLAATTLIKVFIDLFIGIWCFVLALVWQTAFTPANTTSRVRWTELFSRMPLFLIGFFLAFGGLLAAGLTWPELAKPIKSVEAQTEAFRKPLFALAFFAIGLATDFRRLWSPGLGKLVLVYLIALFGFILWIGLAISWLFFQGVPAVAPGGG